MSEREKEIPRELIENLSIKTGGKFKLTAMVQKRLQELNRMSQKSLETSGGDLINTTLHEIANKFDTQIEDSEDKAHLVPIGLPTPQSDFKAAPELTNNNPRIKRRKRKSSSTATRKLAKKTTKKKAKKK